jgi:hypothetical protein
MYSPCFSRTSLILFSSYTTPLSSFVGMRIFTSKPLPYILNRPRCVFMSSESFITLVMTTNYSGVPVTSDWYACGRHCGGGELSVAQESNTEMPGASPYLGIKELGFPVAGSAPSSLGCGGAVGMDDCCSQVTAPTPFCPVTVAG